MIVRLWMLIGASAVTSAFFWRAARAAQRRAALGHCLSCGYDLRASPQRCPECGADALVSLPR